MMEWYKFKPVEGEKDKTKLLVAYWLLFLAIFFWGVKSAPVSKQEKAVKQVTHDLAASLEFASNTVLKIAKHRAQMIFYVGKEKDVITIDKDTGEVKSKLNFTYHFKGFVIKCDVKRNPDGVTYTVSCRAFSQYKESLKR
jgi:hypothetical protein